MNPSNTSINEQTTLEQFVVFQLDTEEYAVPILSVAEVITSIEITPVPSAPEFILGLTNLRGKVLPVLDLEKRFNLARENQVAHQHIVVAESEDGVQFGVLVDQVKEVLKIPKETIKPPPEILKSRISSEYLLGVIVIQGTQAAEERILLILDMKKILSDKSTKELHATVNAITTKPVGTS